MAPALGAPGNLVRLARSASPSRFLLFSSLPALTALTAAVSLVVPMLLGPARFGQYALVETLFRYGLAFDFGLAALMDRRLPVLLATAGAREQGEFINAISWLRLGVGGAGFALSAVLLASLGAAGVLPFGWTLGLLAVAAGIAGMLLNGPTSVERARSHRSQFAVLYASAMAVLTFGRLAGIIVAGVAGCFAVMAVCYAALAARVIARMPPRAPRPRWTTSAGLFGESMPLFLISYVSAIYLTANRWIMSPLMEPVAFGQFAFATGVTTLLLGTVAGMSQLWYPKMARRLASGDAAGVSRGVRRDQQLFALGLSVVTCAGSVAAPWLIAIVYPKFAASVGIVRIVLSSLPALGAATWLMPLAMSTSTRPWLDATAVYPVALLFLLWATEAGFRAGGMAGASWGIVISAVPLLLLQLWRLRTASVLTARDAASLFAVLMLSIAPPAVCALRL
jgi:O-antigen/teichoic acid export membrane protein